MRAPGSISKGAGLKSAPGGAKTASGDKVPAAFAGLAGLTAPSLPPPFAIGGADAQPTSGEGTATGEFNFNCAAIMQHLNSTVEARRACKLQRW